MTRTPRLVVALAAAATAALAVPVVGLVARAPWSTLWREVSSPEVVDALVLSLATATVATALCVVLGVPLAYVLARTSFRGRAIVRALSLLPIVLPPVVGGIALLAVLGRSGLVGRWLDAWFGVQLPFTPAATVIAQVFVALPFLVITVEGALRGTDTRYEQAAATLGATPTRRFTHVTLPLVRPAVVAGAMLAWARALGEFGATVTFAGNLPGRTQTLPIAIYGALERRPKGAIALSVVLLVVSLAVLVALRKRWTPLR